MKAISTALAIALTLHTSAFAGETGDKKAAVDPVLGETVNEAQAAQEPKPGNEFEEGLAAYDKGAYVNAYMLWIPAAVRGDSRAQFNLGVMCLEGKGVAPDVITGLAWILMAVDNMPEGSNRKIAVELRDNITATLNPAQIKQADELKNRWNAEHKEAMKMNSSSGAMKAPSSEAPLPGQMSMPTPIPGKPVSEQPQIQFSGQEIKGGANNSSK